MYSAFDLILASALSSIVSALVCTILWRRQYDRLGDAWMADHLRLEDALEQYEDEPPRVRTPEEQEAERHIRHFREHPEDYTVSIEESDGGVYVTVSLKDPEGGDSDA